MRLEIFFFVVGDSYLDRFSGENSSEDSVMFTESFWMNVYTSKRISDETHTCKQRNNVA